MRGRAARGVCRLGLGRWGTCFWGPTLPGPLPLAKAPSSGLVRAPPRWRSTTGKEAESGLGALSSPHPTSLSRTGQPEPRKWDRKALRVAPWLPNEGLAVKTPLSQGEKPALQAWAQLTLSLWALSLSLSHTAACLGHWLPHHSGRVSATSLTPPGPHTAPVLP